MSYFPEIDKIAYEGPGTDNPFAFRHYNPDEIVEGQSMRVQRVLLAHVPGHRRRSVRGSYDGPAVGRRQ
jgi:xylose isomerase